jgi:mono/diheme cytochrome c family protein
MFNVMKKLLVIFAVLWCAVLISSVSARTQQSSGAKGWKLPATAKEEKNPLTVNDAVLAAGKAQFIKRCSRCHGNEGKGDGPEANEEHADHMNLTRAAGAAQNPDGVVFYKIWYGRSEPRMPAFEDQLTKEQAWAIVAYVQTLRAKK